MHPFLPWRTILLAGIAASWLAACAQDPRQPADAAPLATPCVAGVPAATCCLAGQDSAGVHDLIALLSYLNWATWHFQDIVQNRTGRLNPFDNIDAHYSAGQGDNGALNAGVLR